MGVAVKYAAGVPVLSIILARTTLGIALALTACAMQRVHPLGVQRRALLVRGLVGCGGVIGVLIAASRLPLAVVVRHPPSS
jgi:heme A synthase